MIIRLRLCLSEPPPAWVTPGFGGKTPGFGGRPRSITSINDEHESTPSVHDQSSKGNFKKMQK